MRQNSGKVKPLPNRITWDTATDKACDIGQQPLYSEDRVRIGYIGDPFRHMLKTKIKKRLNKKNSQKVCSINKDKKGQRNNYDNYPEQCDIDSSSIEHSQEDVSDNFLRKLSKSIGRKRKN